MAGRYRRYGEKLALCRHAGGSRSSASYDQVCADVQRGLRTTTWRVAPLSRVGLPPNRHRLAKANRRFSWSGTSCPDAGSRRMDGSWRPTDGLGVRARTHPGPPNLLRNASDAAGVSAPAQPRAARDRNAQERRATETVHSQPGGAAAATLWPSWSPLVRSADSAAAQLANMVQLG